MTEVTRTARVTMMRKINLQEHQDSEPEPLTPAQLNALQRAELGIGIRAADAYGEYILKPSSTVGAIELGDLSVLIEPKIGIPKLLSMACYAIGAYKQRPLDEFEFSKEKSLPDLLALALAAAAQRAFAGGLLHDYRAEEDALYTVRGRIRVADQIRRRFSIPMPIEVGWDEFTDDILANRLVRAAVGRLRRMRLRRTDARRGLAWVSGMLGNVSAVEFRPSDVPGVKFDRLNERYRNVVGLSRLILRHSAFESGRGGVRASGFTMDMNKVFEEFVTTALRDELRGADCIFRAQQWVNLDVDGQVKMRPDLTLTQGGRFVFVGDVKYKRTAPGRILHPDLYQLLAYTTALDMPAGLLIYAKDDSAEGETAERTHTVEHAGKALQIAALNLEGDLFEDVMVDVKRIAGLVRAQVDRIQAAA